MSEIRKDCELHDIPHGIFIPFGEKNSMTIIGPALVIPVGWWDVCPEAFREFCQELYAVLNKWYERYDPFNPEKTTFRSQKINDCLAKRFAVRQESGNCEDQHGTQKAYLTPTQAHNAGVAFCKQFLE